MAGLGEKPEVIERLLNADPEALTLFRAAVVRPKHVHSVDGDSDNITITTKERGTGKAYTLTRLKTKAPALYSAVIAGELSANAAAIQAGLLAFIFPWQFRAVDPLRIGSIGHK